MERRNTAAEIAVTDVEESHTSHEFRQFFLRRESGHRIRQILIGSRIARNGSTQMRKNISKVEAKQVSKDRNNRLRELKDHSGSPGPEQPMDLT